MHCGPFRHCEDSSRSITIKMSAVGIPRLPNESAHGNYESPSRGAHPAPFTFPRLQIAPPLKYNINHLGTLSSSLNTPLKNHFNMAPVSEISSSAVLAAVIDVKTFISQHYILLSLSVLFGYFFYLRYLSAYRDIPGPFLATVSPLWRLRGALNGTLHTDITEAHRKYGTIVRIAPDEVSIADPEAIKIIYGHNAGFVKVPHLRVYLYLTFGRPTTTASGESTHLKLKVSLLTPTKPPMPPNEDSSLTHTVCPVSSRWNPT